MSEYRVQLRRDRVDTAWGFRLQGGSDFNSPLVVQRVFSGSPSDGQLQRGDVVVAINNNDATHALQRQAEEIIKAAGNTLTLVVKRNGGGAQINNVQQQYANEPVQPSYDHRPNQFTAPPHQQPTSFGGSYDGPSSFPQPKKTNVWSPGSPSVAPATSSYQAAASPAMSDGLQRGYGGDNSYEQPRYQPVSYQKPVAPSPVRGNFGGQQQQFSTPEAQTSKAAGSVPWRGGQQQQQPAHVPVQHEYSSPGYPPSATSPNVDDRHMITLAPQGDEDDYEPKSVREIKAMFNKSEAKPMAPKFGGQRKPNKPTFSPAKNSWNSAPATKQSQPSHHFSPTRTFSSSNPPVEERGSVLSPQDYSNAWLPPPQPAKPTTGLITPKNVSSSLRPGAGYSYQGIVTVTPPKKVHGASSSNTSSGSAGAKKKEFDPSQSLVYQMLQEESERAKQGGGGGGVQQEDASGRAGYQKQQQQQQQAAFQQQQRQPSNRLQELLERDRVSTQQEEEIQQNVMQQQYRQPPQPPQARTHHTSNNSQDYYQQTARQQSGYQQGGGGHQQGGYPVQQGGGYQYQQGGGYQQGGYQSAYGADGVPVSDF